MTRGRPKQKTLFEVENKGQSMEVEGENQQPQPEPMEVEKELPPLITIKATLKDVKEAEVEKNVKMIVEKLKAFTPTDPQNPEFEFKFSINVAGVY